MPTAHANNAAAVAAGWARTQADRGAAFGDNRWITRYERPVSGYAGASGGLLSVEATSGVNQADADTKALASLNYLRNHRYGFAAAGGSTGPTGGSALTVDTQ